MVGKGAAEMYGCGGRSMEVKNGEWRCGTRVSE